MLTPLNLPTLQERPPRCGPGWEGRGGVMHHFLQGFRGRYIEKGEVVANREGNQRVNSHSMHVM